MQRRRYWGLIAAGLAVTMTAVLIGCGASSPLKNEVTLKLVAAEHGDRFGNSSKRYWDQVAGAFSARHPDVSVDVDVYPWDQIDEKVAALEAADKAPDIAELAGSFAGYAAKDELYSAKDVLSTVTQAAFIPSLAEAGSVRHVQYGLPFVASTRALFYNKKLFAEAGIEKPPKTWEELRDAAEALKDAGVPIPYSLPLGPEESQAETLNWTLSGGGGYVDDAGGYVIDSPENVDTFTWLKKNMVDEGLTNTDPADTDRSDAYRGFLHGKVGMLNGHPTLMESALENGVNFGTAPLPGKDGASESTTGVADWMVAFKQQKHSEEVRDFLDFAYSKKNVVQFADQYDLLPVTVPASEAMRDDGDHREMWNFLDQLDHAVLYPIGKTSWLPTVRKLRVSIGDAVAEGGDPATVLRGVQRTATAADSAADHP